MNRELLGKKIGENLGRKKKWGGRPKGIGGEREEWVSEGRWRRKGREERGKIK